MGRSTFFTSHSPTHFLSSGQNRRLGKTCKNCGASGHNAATCIAVRPAGEVAPLLSSTPTLAVPAATPCQGSSSSLPAHTSTQLISSADVSASSVISSPSTAAQELMDTSTAISTTGQGAIDTAIRPAGSRKRRMPQSDDGFASPRPKRTRTATSSTSINLVKTSRLKTKAASTIIFARRQGASRLAVVGKPGLVVGGCGKAQRGKRSARPVIHPFGAAGHGPLAVVS